MIGQTYQFPKDQSPGPASVDSIYTAAMTGLYGWTALGMMLAGATGWILHLMEIYPAASLGGLVVTFILVIGLLMGTHFTAGKDIPIAVPAVLYLAFAAIEGAMLAFIFAVFPASTITTAFGGALVIFTLMTVYGLKTGRDLSGLGQLCLMGLLGIIAAGFFNIFVLHSEGLRLTISMVTIPIFMGLTAWETREIKREAQRAATDGDAQAASRLALVGAAGMFLSILNMFLALLNLLSLDFSGLGGK